MSFLLDFSREDQAAKKLIFRQNIGMNVMGLI